jgi:hypothetical protein
MNNFLNMIQHSRLITDHDNNNNSWNNQQINNNNNNNRNAPNKMYEDSNDDSLASLSPSRKSISINIPELNPQ